MEVSQLKFQPIILSVDHRVYIESVVPDICRRGNWEYHIAAGQPDHVHVMIATPNDGKRVRKWLKTWLGQELSKHWPLGPGHTWWAEGGSIKKVWDDDYFANVFEYIRSQRTSK